VVGVVFPSSTLLDSDTSPLSLRKQSVLLESLGLVLGQNHVAVLELAVLVFL
jgi:hypothetical protein